MERKHNKHLVPYARRLRVEMTKEERHLWYDFLREYPLKFTRQKILGRYIIDFFCAKVNLAIELDGSQHYEEDAMVNDEKRTEYLKKFGIRVVRISNLDVIKNFEGVCMHIDREVKQSLSQLR